MAITKAINGSAKTHGALRNTIEYVLRDDKVKEGYVDVIGPSPDTITWDSVYQSFLQEKKTWSKDSGRMDQHFVLSFHKDEKITPAEALQFGRELFAKQFPGYQVLLGVHQDKDHLHVHAVVNSVSYQDGRKLHMSKYDLQHMKDLTNEMCRQRGLTVAEKGRHFDGTVIEAGTGRAWNKDKYLLINEESKKPYLIDCAYAVLDARGVSESREISSERWASVAGQSHGKKSGSISRLQIRRGIRSAIATLARPLPSISERKSLNMNLNDRRKNTEQTENRTQNSNSTTDRSQQQMQELLHKQAETITQLQERLGRKDMQIQSLSSDRQKLTAELQKQAQTVQQLSEQVARLSNSDRELEQAKKLKKNAEEMKERAQKKETELKKLENALEHREADVIKDQKKTDNLRANIWQEIDKKASRIVEQRQAEINANNKANEKELQRKYDDLTFGYAFLLTSLSLYAVIVTVLQFILSDRCRKDLEMFCKGVWSLIYSFAKLTWRIAGFGGAWWILPIVLDAVTAVGVLFLIHKIACVYHDCVIMHGDCYGYYTQEDEKTAIKRAETHAAIAAVVPIAILAWLGRLLPQWCNTVCLYLIIQLIFIYVAYSRNKEHIRTG